MDLNSRIGRLEANCRVNSRGATDGENRAEGWWCCQEYLAGGGDLDVYEDQEFMRPWLGYLEVIEELVSRQSK